MGGDKDVLNNGKKISIPIGNLLKSKHFGLNQRINSRKLEYPTGLSNVMGEVPPASSVETPNVEDFGRNANVGDVLAGWKNRYKGMGFTYNKNKPGINQKYTSVTITAENGATHVTELGRTLGKGKEAQAKAFNKFIEENKI